MHTRPPSADRAIRANASRVRRDGVFVFEVHAAARVRASLSRTWEVLTDYERLPEFVPELVYSRILERNGHQVTIAQQNRAGFLFVSQLVSMVVRIEEHPMTALDVAMVSGDMRHYSAHWELAPLTPDGADGTSIAFTAALEPNLYLPPFVGTPIMQASVTRMVEAVVREIERAPLH